MSVTSEELITLIQAQNANALITLRHLTNYCQWAGGQTLLDAAILSDNRPVIDVLLVDKKAREFSVPLEDDLTDAINYSVHNINIGWPLDKAEQSLRNSFGEQLNLLRTPLLTACRVGNFYAIEALLKAGAKPSAKDRLRLTAPEICFYSGGPEALGVFIELFKTSGQKPFVVNATLVRRLLHYPALLLQLKSVANFGPPVQKLLFCYDCARLDVDAVKQTLAGTFAINKAVTADLHPLREACLSTLFWSDELPEAGYYAYHYTKHAGPAGSHAVQFDNALLKPDGSNFNQLMREAECKRQQLINDAKQLQLSEAAAADQLAKRCAIIDVMIAAGLDIKLALSKLSEFFFDDLQKLPLAPLVQHLANLGLTPGNAQEEVPYCEASWELVGESYLLAKLFNRGKDGWDFTLVYGNGYGPVEGVIVNTRNGDSLLPTAHDEFSRHSDWREHAVQEQWLEVNGELIPRQAIKLPIYAETPWQAIYQWTQANKPTVLEVWLQSPSEHINYVLSDWVIP